MSIVPEPLRVMTGTVVSVHEVAPVPLVYPLGQVVHEIFPVVFVKVFAGQKSAEAAPTFATKYPAGAGVHVPPLTPLYVPSEHMSQLTTHPVDVLSSDPGLQLGAVIVTFLMT